MCVCACVCNICVYVFIFQYFSYFCIADHEELTIGRAFQSATLWEQLIPEEPARSTISRAHFEVFGAKKCLEMGCQTGSSILGIVGVPIDVIVVVRWNE